jgi:hypothetical protein
MSLAAPPSDLSTDYNLCDFLVKASSEENPKEPMDDKPASTPKPYPTLDPLAVAIPSVPVSVRCSSSLCPCMCYSSFSSPPAKAGSGHSPEGVASNPTSISMSLGADPLGADPLGADSIYLSKVTKSPTKRSRTTVTCSVCKQPGHNKKSCEIWKASPDYVMPKKQSYTCSNCGQASHSKVNCTNSPLPRKRKRAKGTTYKCSSCGKLGHNSRRCPMLK